MRAGIVARMMGAVVSPCPPHEVKKSTPAVSETPAAMGSAACAGGGCWAAPSENADTLENRSRRSGTKSSIRKHTFFSWSYLPVEQLGGKEAAIRNEEMGRFRWQCVSNFQLPR